MVDRWQAEQARRAASRETTVLVLAATVLVGMIGYMLVGDRPFKPDLLAASEISPINRWAWLALLGLSVPILWMRRAALLPLARAMWPILVLYAWFGVTTHWALDPASSTRRVVQVSVTLVVCIAIVVGMHKPERIHLVSCLPCIAVVTVDLLSWGVVPHLAMTPLGLQGMHAQKNMLGMFAMYTLVASATCAFGPVGKWQRRMLAGGCVTALLSLLASRSGTSAGLTFAAAAILPALVYLLRRRGLVVASVLVGLLCAIVGGLALYLMWCGMAGADPLAPLAGVTLTKRTDLWAFIIENIHKRPWGGAGFGSFWAIDKAVQPSLQSGLWFGRGVNIAPEGHNAYLDLAATTGLTGLALGLVVVLRAICRAGAAVYQAPRTMKLPTGAFHLGFCIMVAGHSFTESTLFAANSQLGTLFILAAVTLEWARLQAAPARVAPMRRLIVVRRGPVQDRLRGTGQSATPAMRAVPGP